MSQKIKEINQLSTFVTAYRKICFAVCVKVSILINENKIFLQTKSTKLSKLCSAILSSKMVEVV